MKVKASKLDQQARQLCLKEWHAWVKRRPPAARLQWLETALGLVAHGAKQRKQLVAELRALRNHLEWVCCSESWMEARWDHNGRYKGRGMKMSDEGMRRSGDEGITTMRWSCCRS